MIAAWLLSCSGDDGTTVPSTDTARPQTGLTGETGGTTALPPTIDVTLGPVWSLSEPPANGMHHHATNAWGDGDRFAVAWVVNPEPDTQAWVQVFDTTGTPANPPAHLNADGTRGDKPDVEWDGSRYVVAWDDGVGGVFLRGVAPDGAPDAGSSRLQDTTLETDAVDLAVQPGGGGTAIWTESGAPWMDEDDGRIVWRTFDAALAPTGTARLAEESSKKATDASPLPDGGWVGVWAVHYDHPTVVGEVLYEVWGRLYRGDGSTSTFRADDLDGAWPSRPAVAVGPDGALAVSWRDKTSSRGEPAGAYGRLLDADGVPLGPSSAFGPGADGDRVVVAWAGELAVFAWQETAADDRHAAWMSVVDRGTGAVVVDHVELTEPGGDHDERPSISTRPGAAAGTWEVLVTWEVFASTGESHGLRGRLVTLTVEPG